MTFKPYRITLVLESDDGEIINSDLEIEAPTDLAAIRRMRRWVDEQSAQAISKRVIPAYMDEHDD